MGISSGRIEKIDREKLIRLVQEAEAAGASRTASCQILSLNLRRLQSWEAHPEGCDQRLGPKTQPSHTLTKQEQDMIVEVSARPLFCDLSPWQIVSKLADSGTYLASESSFYRVLKRLDLLSHRCKSQPKTRRRPDPLTARNPNEVYSWDITYLKSPVKGMYYYLYLVEDIFSRMIVGWAVHDSESADYAAQLIQRVCHEQKITRHQLRLHSDNGSPMKGATMLAKLQNLGVVPSFSRPSVSDDNPFSESLFKTLKYRPSYPDGAFASIQEAREWVERFVKWYNEEHLHSGIKFVTPACRHEQRDAKILANRSAVYETAKRNHPARWSGSTRNWSFINEVHLNHRNKETNQIEVLSTLVA